MGENGAGKSTLMKILAASIPTTTARSAIDGAPVRFAGVARRRTATGIAIIHQELNLVPELSVADNIFLGREPADRRAVRRPATPGRGRPRRCSSRLGLDLDPDAPVGELRVGEQQLVEIAKALSLDARILIMDEPTSALSPAEAERLFEIIRQLAARRAWRSSTSRTGWRR